MDTSLTTILSKLPTLTVQAGPRDKKKWPLRLKEELTTLIQCVKTNKETDSHWFQIQCNPNGTSWTGTCWYFLDNIRYEFQLAFEIPITYPSTPVELRLPELDGLTSKMYRSGKICQTLHFQPMWKSPQFGIVHSLALSLGPWLAAELPDLIGRGVASRFAK